MPPKMGASSSVNVVEKPRVTGRSVYRNNAGDKIAAVDDYYRINVYIPMIDHVHNHLKDRFGSMQQKTLGLNALIPAHLGTYDDVVVVNCQLQGPRIWERRTDLAGHMVVVVAAAEMQSHKVIAVAVAVEIRSHTVVAAADVGEHHT